MSKKKIAPTLRYEHETGGLKLDIGARTLGVFEGYDDHAQPNCREGVADALGPMLVEAFNALPEEVRVTLREATT